MLAKFLILFTSFFLISFNAKSSINYHGRIISQSSGNPLALPNVRFNVKIKAGATCIVYNENHDNINMSGSNGYFSHNIGEGSVSFGNFDNAMKIDGTSVSCLDGGSASLTSVISKSIDVQILEYDGSNYSINVSQILGLQIKDVPVAIEAKSFGGKSASNFIQVLGGVTQTSLDNLITGTSSLYVLSSDLATQVSSLTAGKLNTASNLLDVPNKASARVNLGLGSLAILNSVSDSNISSLNYSKLTSVPLTFVPSAHSHVISDITNLQTQLTTLQNNINLKLGLSQLSLNCSASQTVQYVSVSDSYQCQSISISSSQVSGLGSLSSLNTVSDSNIVSLSGSKLTGATQIGTVAGTSCTSAGLTRYSSGTLDVCNGSIWLTLISYTGLATSNATMNSVVVQQNIGVDPASTTGGQIYGKVNPIASYVSGDISVDLDKGNTSTLPSSYDCGAGTSINLQNGKAGAIYTIIVTGTGSTACSFKVNGAAATSRFSPTNTTRIAASHSIYSILFTASTTIYISWSTGFQ